MSEKNYQLINVKAGRESYHLFYNEDKCLYKKNGHKKGVYYYSCIGKNEFENEKCSVGGKIIDGRFLITKHAIHNHPNHETKAEAELIYSSLKLEVTNCSDTIESVYRRITAK